MLRINGCGPRDVTELVLARLTSGRPQVLTIHAELEGGPYRREFARLLGRCRQNHVEFFRLQDWARELLHEPEALQVSPVSSRRLPGRAGQVSCQEAPEAESR